MLLFKGAVSLCNAAGLKFSCYGRQSDWNWLCLLIREVTETRHVKEEFILLRSKTEELSLKGVGKEHANGPKHSFSLYP